MHLQVRPLVAAFALVVPAALAAQQISAPARARQGTAQRGTERQGVRPATGRPSQGGPRYEAQQTGSTEPRVAQQGDPRAREPAGRAVIRGVAPQAPFALAPIQQQLLDQILREWERQSDRVKTFKCSFGRWEVNETFGPREFNYVLTEGQGYIKFKAPDHGIYRVTELSEWDDQKRVHVPRTEGLDHWVCTGKSIFEFNTQKKQLIERELAPELQGKAITDGPLPFIFGAKADQLKRRYWMRDVTQPADVNRQIWLEAWPKFQQDAANFQHAIVILNKTTFLPEALRIILPDGKNKQDYAFSNTQVNDPLSILKGDFLPPIKPLGWTSVFEPAERQNRLAPPGGAGAQAQRGAAPAPRK
ncbi:MAG: TIGR03009 domain-containing protein [Pirellulales bacterium]